MLFARLCSLSHYELLRAAFWNDRDCVDLHSSDVFIVDNQGHGLRLVAQLFRRDRKLKLPLIILKGCIFMYVMASAPNRRSLGATNGLSQTTVSVARAVGPAIASSLFSASVQHNLMGGYAVYAIMFVLSCFAVLLAQHLPPEVWPEAENDDDSM